MPWLVREDGEVLATLEVAGSGRSRARGLLGRDGIEGALLIQPAKSVHTFGMRFPIDVVFVDRDWLPIYVEYDVGPRRVLSSRFARSVIEVNAGEAGRLMDGLRIQRALVDGRSAPTAPVPPSR